MKYYLIAGEPSGDLHGSNLIKGLLKADPEARLRFWGGELMGAAGGEGRHARAARRTWPSTTAKPHSSASCRC